MVVWKNKCTFVNEIDELGKRIMNKKLLSLFWGCALPLVLLAGSGDANGDHKVNVADIVEIINYLNGTPSDTFNGNEADISGNGKVNKIDINILEEVIMHEDFDMESALEYYKLLDLIYDAQEKIDELNDKINQTEPKLLHMEFLASENPMQLVENVECIIIGDSAVTCRVLNLMNAKSLIPRFEYTGDRVTIGGQEAISSETAFDFSSEQTLVVHNGEKTKEYTVSLSAYTGLPTLWAETKARKLKEANLYYEATFSLTENAGYGSQSGLQETAGRIMAEGNLRYHTKTAEISDRTEWGKNDYKLSFFSAVPILDMSAHTDWKLMSNVNDITMLHNQTAFYLSEISNLEYKPRFRYVDLMFNGHYSGTYMLGGYLSQQHLSMNTSVDWYLINEIAKNEKGVESLWDFETAFGDAGQTAATGFVLKDAGEYQQLFQDPLFVAEVKERFDYFYSRQTDIIRNINENAQYLKYAIQEDNSKWDTFTSQKSSDTDTWVLYQDKVNSMKIWLTQRMQWLKEQFDAMQASRSREMARWDAAQVQRNTEQDKLNGQLRLMWEALQQRIEALERTLEERMEPRLLTMEFVTSDNQSLRENVKCKIVGDSIIECWLPGTTTDKVLKPRFTYEGTMVVIDGFEAESGKTEIDFTRPRIVAVATSSKNKYYKIYVHSLTGLPMMTITTDNLQEVTSKEVYIGANIVLREDVRTRAAGDVVESRVNIKGRGNSSWKNPKKPFRLKFDEKISLLDMQKDKSWVLIPNYSDKSMLRNSLAFYMSSISNLDYTPESHFVDLTFNGKFWGTYLLCEKLKIAKHRVNVGDDGFLFEIDFRCIDEADSRYFSVPHLENVVNIKDPEVEYGDANFQYAKDFVNRADEALFSSNFTDPATGWQAYLDIDSFVDYYLIQEIGKNLDGDFDSSCFMHLARGGKLKMGPIWDMDVAFGNIDQANQTCYDPEGFYIKNAQWYNRLFKDPVFVARVKERFNYFYQHQNDILANINADAQYIKYSAQENNDVWHLLNVLTWSNHNIWGSYQNEVQDLKVWFTTRMEWLKTQFDKM